MSNDTLKELTKQAYLRGYAEGVLEMAIIMRPSEGSDQYKRFQEIVGGIIERGI